MPGKWTPEHRAAFAATIVARQTARENGVPYTKPARRPRITVDPMLAEGLDLGRDFDRAMSEVRAVLERTTDAQRAAMAQGFKDLAAAVPDLEVADYVERIRSTALRIEDLLTSSRQPVVLQKADAQLVDAMRRLTGRIAALEASVAAQRRDDSEILHLLRRIDSRPSRVVEFRPVHKREAEGGEPVRKQRASAGLTKRQRAG